MAVQFNPPPGWLVPPGFSPSPNWHPDPAWPAAPTGWVFWVEAAPAPVPAPPSAGAEAWSRETPGGGIPLHFSTAVPAGAPSVATPHLAATASSPGNGVPSTGPTRRSLRDTDRDVPPMEAASSTMILPVIGGGVGGAVPVGRGVSSQAQPVEPAGSSVHGPLSIFSGDDEPREERPYMRWLLPVGVGIGGVALGLILGLGITLKAQSEAGDAAAAAAHTTEQMAAERAKLDKERADLDEQLAGIGTTTDALTAREAELATKEAELNDRDAALDERESSIADSEANNNNNNGGWDPGKVNGIYLTCEAAKRDGKAPLKQGDQGFNPALDWDGNGVACER